MLATKFQMSNPTRIERAPKTPLQGLRFFSEEQLFTQLRKHVKSLSRKIPWEGTHQKVWLYPLMPTSHSSFSSVFKADNKNIFFFAAFESLLNNCTNTVYSSRSTAQPWLNGSLLVLGKQPQQMVFITATVPGMWPGKKVAWPENFYSSVTLVATMAQGIHRQLPDNTWRTTWLTPELQRNLSALSWFCTPSLAPLCERKEQNKQSGPLC